MNRREPINLRSPVKIYEVEDQTVIEMREPTGNYGVFYKFTAQAQ